ncbi:MAG: DEAD/DEAH box helicase [Elusimicrobiota bacterium]
MDKLKFNELSLSPEILKAVSAMGFEETTPIQSLTIPLISKKLDVIGQAQTGTGKTAAFGIPILETINTKNRNPQAIILCPTRELVIQVTEELNRLAKFKPYIRTLPIYGGQPIGRQIYSLQQGVQIVIGTPGRVMDHLRRNTLQLGQIQTVVLDEADEMLNMGFRDDIEIILKEVPTERQTVCFSATMPKAFINLTSKYMKNPKLVQIVHDNKLTVANTKQVYYEINEQTKLDCLMRVIDYYNLHLSLVFCNTKWKVDDLISQLQSRGYSADAIHGDMNQSQRNRVMEKFRNSAIEILVATDVAARGIDVENIEAVFNYDVPQDEEYYVHRIGRTGRAGKTGKAFTLVAGRDMYKLRDIQRYANTKIIRENIPSHKEVEQNQVTQLFEKVREVMGKGKLTHYTTMLETLINNNTTSLEIAGALLKLLIEKQVEKQTVSIPEKTELRQEPRRHNRPERQQQRRHTNNRDSGHGVFPPSGRPRRKHWRDRY